MTEKINKEEVEILSLFSTPIVKINIDRDFTKEELQLCITDIPSYIDKKIGMQNHVSVNLTLFNTFAEELIDIRNFCEYHLRKYLKEIEGADTNKVMLRITQSWLNKIKPQEYFEQHHHPNSYLSGVLYISCLPNDCINFNNQSYRLYNNMEFPKKKNTQWNVDIIQVNVEEGDLILFPSGITHSVNLNDTKDKERISLGFNTFPMGEMGKGATHLKL